MLTEGLKSKKTVTVGAENTAAKVGSGTLPVFATPAMATLCEATAAESVEELLGEGKTSVGTLLRLSHVAATPVGMQVTCESMLTKIDGRRLDFTLTVYDDAGVVGECEHERFVVDSARFLEKALGRRKNTSNG